MAGRSEMASRANNYYRPKGGHSYGRPTISNRQSNKENKSTKQHLAAHARNGRSTGNAQQEPVLIVVSSMRVSPRSARGNGSGTGQGTEAATLQALNYNYHRQ